MMRSKTTDAVARMYVIAGTVLAFFILWSLVAAQPFPAAAAQRERSVVTAPDPRLAAIERAFNLRSAMVRARIDARWAAYRQARAVRLQQIALVRRANAAARASSGTYSGGSYGGSYGSSSGYQAPRTNTPQVRVIPTYSAPPVTSTRSS